MTWRGVLTRSRPVLASVLLLMVAWPVWKGFEQARPLVSWYFPRLAATWLFTLLFVVSSLSIGARAVKWLTGPVPRDGFWALSFATGVLIYGMCIGVAGHLGLLIPMSFGLLPLGLLLAGWGSFAEELLAARERWRLQAPLSAAEVIVGALGVVAFFVAVLPIYAPENVNYDARWYHLAIAERYALTGAITASVEGNHLIAGPHLASLLYTWAFLRDGVGTFDKVLLASHLEVACFVGTLALVPALTRALAPKDAGTAHRMAWVAVFLFPSLYIYDTALMGGADHVGALWAPAAVLTFFQARERTDDRSWALFGLSLGGVALAKYTSIILLAPMVFLVVAGAVPFSNFKQRFPRMLRGPLVAGAVSLVVTSLHWLRNVVFYKNPVYPLASRLFTATTPWTPDSAAWHARYSRELFVPNDARLLSRVQELGDALWGYHVDLYTWRDFTGGMPVFGSLYAISLVLLPFVRGVKRLWAVALIVHVGVVIWFTLAHQMRYLILLVPLMAASCAVLAWEAWRWRSWPLRLVLILVIGLQVVGAGDAPFAPTHRTNGKVSALGRAVVFLGRGMGEENDARFRLFREMEEVGAALPPRAVLLVHSSHATLGINRLIVTDTPGIEYGLNYAALGSVRAVHQRLVEMGVTHLTSVDSVAQPDSVAGELLFRALMATATEPERQNVHGWALAELSPEPPPEPAHTVLYLGCGVSYVNGLYDLAGLSSPLAPSNEDPVYPPPKESGEVLSLLAKANYVVQEDGCPAQVGLDGTLQYLGRQETRGLMRTYYLRRVPLAP